MGAGKSTVADLLKARLSKVLFTGLDRIKWSLAGFSRTSEENKLVAHLVESLAKTALEDGISVCVEQGFMRSEYVEPFTKIAEELNVKFLMFQIEAPREVLIDRLSARKTPIEAKEPVSKEKIEKNLDTYFENKYSQAQVFDSSKNSPEEIAQMIFEKLHDFNFSAERSR